MANNEKTKQTILILLASYAALFMAAKQAHGQADTEVEEFFGAYRTDIPIVAPRFFGITPAIQLAYDSASQNGFAGVGWSLSGFSEIKRTSRNGGTPHYDESDVFALNRQPLVNSTRLGGTHATRIQNYLRIQYSDVDDEWVVTDKGGTKSVYKKLAGESHTIHWGLATVTDTSGNTVKYHWWCDKTSACYPASITYGRNRIRFYRETRPDPISYANGGHLANMSYRLKTIDVIANGRRARSFALSYRTSESTHRSVLSRVQQYGRDAKLSSSGTVLDGTASPPIILTTSAGTREGAPARTWSDYWNIYTSNARPYRIYPGDYNGDGKQDLLYLHAQYLLHGWQLKLSTNDGSEASFTAQAYELAYAPSGGAPWIYPGDYDGDGKQDLLYLHREYRRYGWRLMKGTSDGLAAPVTWSTYERMYYRREQGLWLYPGDYNGDGKQDLLYLHANYQRYGWRLMLGTDTGFARPVTWHAYSERVAANSHGPWIHPGDYNGDGKQDLLYRTHYSPTRWRLLASTGTKSASPVTWQTYEKIKSHQWVKPGDYNGDGKSDLLYLHRDSGRYGWRLMTSLGNVGTAPITWREFERVYNASPSYLRAADFNGDGRQDLLYLHNATSRRAEWRLMASKGTTGAAPFTWAPYEVVTLGRFYITDTNGDGAADLLYQHGAYWKVVDNQTRRDLVTQSSNGLGSTTTIEYAPSSAWDNTNNPPIVQTVTKVTQTDGRGNAAETKYRYSGGLVDRENRRFLGFHRATQTMPCLDSETVCPYQITEFEQDYGSISKPRRIDQFDGNAQLLSSTQMVYRTNGGRLPHTSNQSETWTYVYDGESFQRAVITRAFDVYGNVTQETSWGDYDEDGDETTIRYRYRVNKLSYIVGKPAMISTFAGTAVAGRPLAQTVTFYDGNDDWRVAPLRGKPTRSALWLDTTNSYISTTATYDDWGNLTSETDALGNATTYEFDNTRQFVTRTTNALGHRTTARWDPACATRTQIVAPNGGVTKRRYDALCRLTRTDTPGSGWSTHDYYDYVDEATTSYVEVRGPSADGRGDQWTRSYSDGLGRTWRVANKGPSARHTIYDDTQYTARGTIAKTSGAYYATQTPHWTVAAYDVQDRPTRITHADGTTAITRYGLRETTHIDEGGHQRIEKRDARGHVIERIEKLGRKSLVTTLDYDRAGNLTTVIDPAGNVSTFQYDSLRRKLKSTEPNLGTWHYEYDDAGRIVAQTDAKGQRTTYEYDALNRRVRQTALANTSEASDITWTYDERRRGFFNTGRRTSMNDDAGTVSYNYDDAGRMVNSTRITPDGTTYTFHKGYDAAGRLLWTHYPDGDSVGNRSTPLRYDGAGRLKSIPGVVRNATYTAAGQLLEQFNSNGTVTTNAYSPRRGWLDSITTRAGSRMIQDISYTRDNEGRIKTITGLVSDQRWHYEYDDLDRLTRARNASDRSASEHIRYSEDGNITARPYAPLRAYGYGPTGGVRPHAVTSARGPAGNHTYTYDDNGNMIAGAGRTLRWNGRNQLASVNDTEFVYDGDGSRFKATGSTSSTTYLGDYEITDGVVTKYIHLAGALVAKRVDAETQWIHVNHLGSTAAITDRRGDVVHRKTYRVFGEVHTESGTGESRGFTGQRLDDSGLIYLNARYYDPALGRFISPDPTAVSATSTGLNRYAYAGNNPVSFTDTDGLSWLSKRWKRIKRRVKKLIKRVAKNMSRLDRNSAAFVSKIPVTGSTFALPFLFHSAVLSGDTDQAARLAGTMAVMAAAAVLTTMTGGIASPVLYVAANAAIGFGSGFATAKINGASTSDAVKAGAIGAAISGGTAALAKLNESMRADQINSSSGNPDNVSGRSHGFSLDGTGDGTKLAGGRRLSNGSLGARSPLGGHQGGQGRIGFGGLSYEYPSGGLVDRIVEAYAGPHDWLNGQWGSYGPSGNLSSTIGFPQHVGNVVNVPVATPIALAGFSQSIGSTAFVVGDMALQYTAQSDAQRRSPSTFMAAGGR